MKFEIKSRFNGSILFAVEAESWRMAIELAIKARAYLTGAYLRDADLRGADLRDADLRGADLRDADLRDADLRDADLRDAVGINKFLSTPLLMLLEQPGPIRAYKLVNQNGEGIYSRQNDYSPINYLDPTMEEFAVLNFDMNDQNQCGAGINLATLDWCIKEWKLSYRILIMEFTANDIAAIPIGTDGKFRVKRCRRIGEKDLAEIGLADVV